MIFGVDHLQEMKIKMCPCGNIYFSPSLNQLKHTIKLALIIHIMYICVQLCAGMLWYLAWSILGTRGFKFVQMKFLGSCMPSGLNF